MPCWWRRWQDSAYVDPADTHPNRRSSRQDTGSVPVCVAPGTPLRSGGVRELAPVRRELTGNGRAPGSW